MITNSLAIGAVAACVMVCTAHSGCFVPKGMWTPEECGKPNPGWARGPTPEEILIHRGMDPSLLTVKPAHEE